MCDLDELVPVCRNFFMWVLDISNNKIDQPTLKQPDAHQEFSVDMQGPRIHSQWDEPAKECIAKWLTSFAVFHMHDPTDKLIIANRKQVYENYRADFDKPSERRFYPAKNGDVYLPSQSYFLRTWKNDED